MKNNKVLVFEKLTIWNLIFFFILKIFNFKIYYISISINLRKYFIINFLKKFNIEWFNYEKFDHQEIYSNKTQISKVFCDKYTDFIANQVWSKDLSSIFINKYHLSACLNYKIKERANQIIELLEVAKILGKKNKVYVWSPNSDLFEKINFKFYRVKNLYLLFNFKFISTFLILINKFTFLVLKQFYFLIFFLIKNFYNQVSDKKINFGTEVAFFPHKGMYTQNILKDYYYSNNKKSLFYKSKILHIEWQKKDINNTSKQFYKKNKINLLFWNDIKYRKTSLIDTLRFFFKTLNIYIFLKEKGISTYFYLSVFHIIHAKKKLENIKNLKLILVGYDNLFPPEISVAAKLCNINTIALQERVIVPSWVHKMIFDYYFVIGKKSYDIVRFRMKNTIRNITRLYQQKKDKYKIHLKEIKTKKYKLSCLVIDMHSLPINNWYENGRILNNWKSNKKFYNEIIFLANKYKNIEFLIKSKNYIWLNNPEFKTVCKIMHATKNIKILHNQKIWTPEKSINISDFAIARYSSLADEFLNLGKPVILYDLKGYPQKFFNYGDKLISSNVNHIEKKLKKLTKNLNKFNKSLDKDREKLFFKKKNNKLITILENLI